MDVGFDPGEGLFRISDPGQVLVSKADDKLDAGVGEGLEDAGIGVVEFDPGGANGFDEGDNGLRVGEVVGDLAVVDAEGESRREEE